MDVMVGMTLLAIAAVALTTLLLTAMALAKSSGVHAEAAAWTQAEMDYLRGVGYTSSCLNAGTATITTSTTSCTTSASLPTDFTQATVQVENNVLSQTGLKRITILVYKGGTAAANVYYRVVTYVTQFS
jgi:hypothetical protein